MDILLPRLFSYFKVIPQEADGLKPLGDEIRHFRHIKVFLQDITALQEKIERIRERPRRIAELRARYEARQLSFDELFQQAQAIPSDESFTHNGQTLHIKQVARHYSMPVLLSENERIDWIRHVVRHPSEVRFHNNLEEYLNQPQNAFARLNWWAFSKIDENLDEVYIPYYDPQSNRIHRFLPDFIFWLRKENQYAIVFVDPKGMQQADYQYKVDGYRALFWEKGVPMVFRYNDLNVRVYLLLYTEDANRAPADYRDHWVDNPHKIVECVIMNGG
jgi:hypothetical protein